MRCSNSLHITTEVAGLANVILRSICSSYSFRAISCAATHTKEANMISKFDIEGLHSF
jgi:hypothetical protein